MIKNIFTLIAILFSISNLLAQNSFAPYQMHVTGSEPEVVTIADLNNDGLNDVIVGTIFNFDSLNDFKLNVFYQTSAGNLSASIKYPYRSSYNGIKSISSGDVNNDSLTDLVIGFDDSIGVFYQNNLGTLNPQVSYFAGNTVLSVKVGDLNNDGLNDIAASCHSAHYVKVFYQNSGGFSTFTRPKVQQGFEEIELGDINNDGLTDLVLLTGGLSGGLHIYKQNSLGLLDNAIDYYTPLNTWGINGLAVGDLNGDGRKDIAISGDGNNPNCKLIIYIQDASTGTLLSPTTRFAYDMPGAIEIADITCDGSNEIIVANESWYTISIYPQSSSNYTLYPTSAFTNDNPQSMSVGDINNDGSKDIAVVDYNFGLSILLNNSPTPAVSFTNYDTLVTVDTIYHNIQEVSSFNYIRSILNNDTTCNVFQLDSFEIKKTFSLDSIKLDSNFIKSVMKCSLYQKKILHSYYYFSNNLISMDTIVLSSVIDTIFTPMVVKDTIAKTVNIYHDTIVRNSSYINVIRIQKNSGCSFYQKNIFSVAKKLVLDSIQLDTLFIRYATTCNFQRVDTIYSKTIISDSTLIKSDTLLISSSTDTVDNGQGDNSEYCNMIKAFPIPTTKNFTLEITNPCFDFFGESNLNLDLYDVEARLIFSKRLEKIQLPAMIDLSNYANSIYCLKITSGEKFCIKKIVKEK